jgi:hypothetical protein
MLYCCVEVRAKFFTNNPTRRRIAVKSIIFVTTYPEIHRDIFLVILNRIAYLISWMLDTQEFSHLCPCCMYDTDREAVANVIRLARGQFDGRVRWCCHKENMDYGDTIGTDYPPLDGNLFCVGNAEENLVGMKDEIQAEAEHQRAIGKIK